MKGIITLQYKRREWYKKNVLHRPLHTVCTSLPAQKVLQYFWESLWTCCGCCGISSDSDLALLSLALQIHSFPQSLESQANCRDLICCTCGYRSEFPSSSLFAQPLVLHFGLGPTSVCRPPSSVFPTQTRRGRSSSSLRLTCSVRLGRRRALEASDGGVPAAAKACGKFPQSDVGRALSQGIGPSLVSLSRANCVGSQEDMGCNVCLLTAWWQLLLLELGL